MYADIRLFSNGLREVICQSFAAVDIPQDNLKIFLGADQDAE